MMNMVDLVAINVEIPKINSRCFLEKIFAKSIHINP